MKLKNIILQGEKIDLRLIQTEDIEKYFIAGFKETDEDIDYYTGTNDKFTKDMIENYVFNIVNDDTRYDFLILDKNNAILGEIVLNEIEKYSRKANFRIALFKSSSCGNGYGTQAMKLIFKFAFESLNLHRIELEVYSFNIRAQKAYRKVGFLKEGVKRDGELLNGRYCDVITMSMLESDYETNRHTFQ
ncbi:GNAT family N-acetyltransferase [Clostridium sp. SHJSY1]|uniref:GNAT family N-acetyltransferase n=1 Tax=Clostridium sp. SHJSY1 TaxID=2942483 RepID=UPI002874114F|nr:GNAT family protein [Clostridium sp. SHJSY1]MDS0526147.1 GNAT family N-acetyltransferase [Clostridium sp. SHJSY1]